MLPFVVIRKSAIVIGGRKAAWSFLYLTAASICAIPTHMADIVYKDKFIWDAAKNEANKEKHPGIGFELADGGV
ncbi:hypothetical protein FACS1894200_05400 [Spirochaetia bacterium]|nr:hypothetical protein FACS1894200_05400 [Spirochaetia bacterium]